MKTFIQSKYILTVILIFTLTSCSKEFLELEPKGLILESAFYQTEEEMFEALVAVYDVLSWGGTAGWTMQLGLLNAASDDCYAGGSDASDQPNWVAYNDFTLDPFLGPQQGIWNKAYSGIYRANLFLEKLPSVEEIDETFVARTSAEIKFLRAYFYFDLVRFFGNAPLITKTLTGDEFYTQTQATSEELYAQIEQDLNDAKSAFELPESLPGGEFGRITKGAVTALLGKVILYQNDAARMNEAAQLFDEVINSGFYSLEQNFGDLFSTSNEFGTESIFEIHQSNKTAGGWGQFSNQTEGNYNIQFFGMRDYVGPTYSTGWSFCPVTEKLYDLLKNDPRFQHTIIDANALVNQGASYAPAFQDTGYFIRKYAPLQDNSAPDGEVALNWNNNIIEIRLADVLLMAAEAYNRSGNDEMAKTYLNQVRSRVGLQPLNLFGADLLEWIYIERQKELATEGHRFFDLVRTGRAVAELGDQGFTAGKNEILPIPQREIDLTQGSLIQNPGY